MQPIGVQPGDVGSVWGVVEEEEEQPTAQGLWPER